MIIKHIPIKLLFAFLLLGFFTHSLSAQETIATARPTLSIGPWVLPENSFQWEQGAQYSDIDRDEWAYDALIRASLSRSTEIRISIPTLEDRFATMGLKWMMIQPEGNKPGIGFSINMGSKSNSNEGGNSFKVLGYRVAVNKNLSDKLVGFINAGYTSGGYFGDFTLAYALIDGLTATAEYWHHQDYKQVQSTVSYLINSETQIDLNGGLLFDAGNDYTFGFGLSRRFKYTGSRNNQ
ncbi:MAG: hypothetical protein ABJF11_08825 [Reichenbachiella sp.]|uniref:hypothetical protein n=1 Tax=Reichenbachiella sp. TaxID=2184521 RepID=UPI003263B8F0